MADSWIPFWTILRDDLWTMYEGPFGDKWWTNGLPAAWLFIFFSIHLYTTFPILILYIKEKQDLWLDRTIRILLATKFSSNAWKWAHAAISSYGWILPCIAYTRPAKHSLNAYCLILFYFSSRSSRVIRNTNSRTRALKVTAFCLIQPSSRCIAEIKA